MRKYFGFVAVLVLLFSCAEPERNNPYDELAYNFIGKSSSEGLSSSVEVGEPSSSSGKEEPSSSSSDEELSSSSAGVSSSVETDNYPSSSSIVYSSSSVEPSSSSAEPSSSSEAESSSSVAPSSSSVEPSSSSAEPSSSSEAESSSSIATSSSSATLSSSSSKSLCANFVEETEREHYGIMKKQFCDERDGKIYVYVVIGTQTWMAENLNYAEEGKCYGDNDGGDSQNMCGTYGRLYSWGTAKTVCPKEWHLPTKDDWGELSIYVQSTSSCTNCDAKLLKSASGWNDYQGESGGTDAYGFSALPGGYDGAVGGFNNVGHSGYWWSDSEYEGNSYGAYDLTLYYYAEGANWGNYNKSFLFSVRCLQDASEPSGTQTKFHFFIQP